MRAFSDKPGIWLVGAEAPAVSLLDGSVRFAAIMTLTHEVQQNSTFSQPFVAASARRVCAECGARPVAFRAFGGAAKGSVADPARSAAWTSATELRNTVLFRSAFVFAC